MKNVACLRCNRAMEHAGESKLQLGEMGWFSGHWPNLLAGALEVDIYVCPECGKIEFFQPQEDEERIAKRECPKCGEKHDWDYPKCPFCNYDYYSK